ncbi:MAG: PEP-utilizing enzyme [Candidatus Woesearchaeota archaeon]|nr:PEP-utilizing enzyme [Candidatus Woesearchaeota archaeon]
MVNIKDISKHRPEEWLIEHIDACPFFIESSAYGFTVAFKEFEHKYDFTLAFFHDDQMDWATLIPDQDRIGMKIVEIGLKNEEFFPGFFKRWNKGFKEFYRYALRIRKSDFSRLNDKELRNLFEDYQDKLKKTHFPGFIDSFIFCSDRYFTKIVTEFSEKSDIADVHKVMSVLSAPVDPSFMFESKEELYNMNKTSSQKDMKQAIKRYMNRFFWMKGSYAGSIEYTEDELLKEMKESRQKPKAFHLENKKEKEKLLRKYHFTKEIISMVKLIELFAIWQDIRKIYTLTHVYIDDKFLREAEKREKISRELLKYSTYEEFSRLLNSKINKKMYERQLVQRNEGLLWVYEGGKPSNIISGEESKRILQSIQQKHEEVNEIKGIAASLGKAKGRVIIVRKIDNIKNVKEGDVLVTPMTRPEHVPALKKVSAIVTDDGGITCHAAIISRELRIPCIIGTKIATKVLKDGDMVEVDADKGIVRKING